MRREEKWYPTILRVICLYIRYDSRYAWEECEDVPSFIDFADNDVQGLNLCLCSVILNEISISYIKVIDPVIKSIKKVKDMGFFSAGYQQIFTTSQNLLRRVLAISISYLNILFYERSWLQKWYVNLLNE